MKLKSLSVILALILMLGACAGGGISSDQQVNTLSVTGNGRVPVQPDIAYISIGVHSSGEDVTTTVDENNALIEGITQTLIEEFSISEMDIQTSNFNLWVGDQYSPEGEKIGVQYTVDNNVYVTVRNLDNLSQILDEVIESGANSIWGIQFDVADKSTAIDEARNQAVENAKLQAEALAQEAGVSLGEIQTISTYGGGSPMPYFAGMGGGGGGGAESTVPISAGQLMVSVDVSITYKITP